MLGCRAHELINLGRVMVGMLLQQHSMVSRYDGFLPS